MDTPVKKQNLFYRVLKTTGRFLLWILAICFVVFIVIDIAIWAAIGWTRTENGQAWLQSQIETATQDTGLKIEFDNLSYHPSISIRANNLRVSDAQGIFLSVDKADIGVNIFPLAMKKASLHFWANEFSFLRSPVLETAPAEVSEEIQEPFTMPDVYFEKFALSLDIKKLIIGEELAGQPLVLTPDLDADFELRGNDIISNLRLNIQQNGEEKIEALPEQIVFNGIINPATLAFDIQKFLVTSPLYTAETKGFSDIQSAAIKTTVQIHQDTPVPAIEISLDAKELTERPNGTMTIGTMVDELPVALTSDFLFENDVLTVNNLSSTLPDIDLDGDIKIDTATSISEGKVKLDIKSLKQYSKWIGAFDASGLVELNASDENGAQKAKLVLKNIRTQDGTISDLSANLEPTESGEYKITFTTQAISPYINEAPVSLKGGLLISGDFSAFKDIDASIALFGGAIGIKGFYNTEDMDISVSTSKFPINNVVQSFAPSAGIDLSKSPLNLNTSLKGSPASPVLVLDGDLTSPQYKAKIIFNAKTEEEKLKASVKVDRKDIKELNGSFEMPFKLSVSPFVLDYSLDNPIYAQLNASLLLQELTPLFLSSDQTLNGLVKANTTVTGSLNQPEYNGAITMNKGTYEYQDIGLTLSDIILDIGIEKDTVTIKKFTAHDGGTGKIDIKGSATIPNAENPLKADIKINVDNLNLRQNTLTNMVHGQVSTHLTFLGDNNTYDLKGDIGIAELDITLIEKFSTTIPELNIVRKEDEKKNEIPLVINLDIDFKAPQRVFVRGWGLDAEFGGELDITGTASEPMINGNLSSIRGRYEEFGKRFTLKKADMRFQGAVPPSPYLDIVASITVKGTEALIQLGGSVEDPKITFASVPALPQDEVLSLILFGKDMTKISPMQAVQLAQTARRFSGQGGGGLDPLAMLRNATGLDDLTVDNEEGSGVSVGAGKYLTDDVYLQFKKGQEENSGAAILQYEMTPNITVESEVGQDAQAGGGIFWKWDY